MVVGQVVTGSDSHKIVKLTMGETETNMLNTSSSTDLNNLSSKDATQII